MAKKITEYLRQEDNFLIALKPCTLLLSLEQYSIDNMKIESNSIWVKSLLAKAEFSDKIFDITLDYSVNLIIYKFEKIGKEFIKLTYAENSTILELFADAGEMKGKIAYVERLINGKEILKDPSHLYRKFLAVYAAESDMDSVHIEIICSQILRDKNDIQRPARLAKKYDPIVVNMKKVIFSESFVNGLAFENVNDAIKTGLISEDTGESSIIEKVMTGTLLSGESRRTKLASSTYKIT